METQWSRLLTGMTLIFTLFTQHAALPTDFDSDVAVRLQHTDTADNHMISGQQSSNADSIGSSLQAHSESKDLPPAPKLESPGFTPDVPLPNSPFTNHFVLDTANLDLDGDGCIAGEPELDLFKYHVATALAGSPNNMLRAHSIVHRTDTNKDGRICWCDFISIYLHDKEDTNVRHHSAPFVVILDKDSGMFSRLDQDKNGLLKGAELDLLAQQFAKCIAEEQARLIVTAMTGLGVKDGAISSTEFARFLGINDPLQTDAKPALANLDQIHANTAASANAIGNGEQEINKQQSKISQVPPSTTSLSDSPRAAAENKMAAQERETPKLQA